MSPLTLVSQIIRRASIGNVGPCTYAPVTAITLFRYHGICWPCVRAI